MADKFDVYITNSRSGNRRALVMRLPSTWTIDPKQLSSFIAKGHRLRVGRSVPGVLARSMLGTLEALGGVGELESAGETTSVASSPPVAAPPVVPAPSLVLAPSVVPAPSVVAAPPVVVPAPVAMLSPATLPAPAEKPAPLVAPVSAVAASLPLAQSPSAAPLATPQANRGIQLAIGLALLAVIGYLFAVLR